MVLSIQLSYNRSSHFIKSYSNQYIYKSINTNQQVDISRLLYRDSKKKIILKGILKHKSKNGISQTADINQ
nr:ShlB/FhaC/HecB family hemolysin secretion/activation protein [Proteus mirabilis]